jgi:peptide/nickel transport system permease protein
MTMFWFFCKRLLQAIAVLWGIATIVFFLMRVIGNQAQLELPIDATPKQVHALEVSLGLTKPLLSQYGHFLSGLLHGSVGESTWLQVPAMQAALQAFPYTLLLAAVTMAVAVVAGIGLGTIAAIRPRSIASSLVGALSYAGISLPDFWVGLVLIAVFSVSLGILPTSGFSGPQYLILPVITLLARPVGRIAQTSRLALADELSKQYVVAARARGVGSTAAVVRHALRNSLQAVIVLTADEAASLVAGAVVVETVFAWPGAARLSIEAIDNRDPNLVTAIVLLVSALVLIINLLVDLSYSVIDPKARAQWQST